MQSLVSLRPIISGDEMDRKLLARVIHCHDCFLLCIGSGINNVRTSGNAIEDENFNPDEDRTDYIV